MLLVRNITRIISWLAGSIISSIVLIIPFGYFLISYQYLSGSIETEAEISARIITQFITQNPAMWEVEQVRLKEYLAPRSTNEPTEIKRVFTARNELVVETKEALRPPVIKRSRELFDSGTVVGKIEISRSYLPLILKTCLLIMLMLPLGIFALFVLHRLPIQALRRNEDAVKQERDTAQKYLDVAGVMLVALDADERVTMINRRGREIIGCDEQKILRKNWFQNFVPETNREESRNVFLMLQKGIFGQFKHMESPVLAADGNQHMIAWHHLVLRDAEGTFSGILSSGEDVTDRMHLETQLRSAQKMEAIGVLAGGIAHDFNNILTAIIGYATILQMQIPKNDPLLHNVEHILASSERAVHLIKSLLAYSRRQIVEPRLVKVNDIVRTVKKIFPSLLREDIELRTTLSDEPLTINADPGQIEQILMNLLTNARDAMPEGGKLFIETGKIDLDEGFYYAHGYGTPGSYALIIVSDTGMGMSRETTEKIFDPFFTTKEVGKGTGLGLAMVYGIIKQHKGYINVYSEPGRGATFKIYIPLVPVQTQDATKSESPPQTGGGTETILIAEDDEAVRRMTTAVLEDAGYTIVEARDGEEAVREFSESRKPIHLVILDVIMPKKNGKAVYDEIRRLRPDVKVLFTSGYTADVLETQALVGLDVRFLQKPASPRVLLKTVRETLDAA